MLRLTGSRSPASNLSHTVLRWSLKRSLARTACTACTAPSLQSPLQVCGSLQLETGKEFQGISFLFSLFRFPSLWEGLIGSWKPLQHMNGSSNPPVN